MMNTAYVQVAHTEHGDSIIKGEVRVEPSEAHEGLLDVGVYGWTNGDQKTLLSFTREQVTELRDALNVYLGEGS